VTINDIQMYSTPMNTIIRKKHIFLSMGRLNVLQFGELDIITAKSLPLAYIMHVHKNKTDF